MRNPEVIWILPNRNQDGEETAIKNGLSMKLTDAIKVKDLPEMIVLGIPEGILKKHPDENLIYSQYCRQKIHDRNIFVLSVKCGTDKSNRIVYLIVLEILKHGMDPIIMPDAAGLPEYEQKMVYQIAQRYEKDEDKWINTVKAMLRCVKSDRKERINSFANIKNSDAVYDVEWTPQKKNSRSQYGSR